MKKKKINIQLNSCDKINVDSFISVRRFFCSQKHNCSQKLYTRIFNNRNVLKRKGIQMLNLGNNYKII